MLSLYEVKKHIKTKKEESHSTSLAHENVEIKIDSEYGTSSSFSTTQSLFKNPDISKDIKMIRARGFDLLNTNKNAFEDYCDKLDPKMLKNLCQLFENRILEAAFRPILALLGISNPVVISVVMIALFAGKAHAQEIFPGLTFVDGPAPELGSSQCQRTGPFDECEEFHAVDPITGDSIASGTLELDFRTLDPDSSFTRRTRLLDCLFEKSEGQDILGQSLGDNPDPGDLTQTCTISTETVEAITIEMRLRGVPPEGCLFADNLLRGKYQDCDSTLARAKAAWDTWGKYVTIGVASVGASALCLAGYQIKQKCFSGEPKGRQRLQTVTGNRHRYSPV